jgi:Raf kinase inhibitor-like YbhB/YbcL family protein
MRNPIIPLLLLSAPALADAPRTLQVTSNAFVQNSSIPSEYTCDGAEVSPQLSWSNVPAETKSIAIMAEDPDAPKGTITHWIVANIKPSVTELAAGAPLPEHAMMMKNEKGKTGYMGPCPPTGEHHYHFRVYALDTEIVPMGSRREFLHNTKGHVIAQGDLVGLYHKR